MAKAKKLPSGKWRCLVYDFTDSSNKRHYKSFTGETKREAEFSAAEYAAGRSKQPVKDITLNTAITEYIDIKRGVLSPSTISSYIGLQKNYFKEIGTIPLKELDNTQLQIWVSTVSKKVSPKTVRNAHGLLVAALDMFVPDFKVKTTLPPKKKPELYTPSDNDIITLLNHIKGTELEIAVLLAAFGPMRRGEICALESTDINKNTVSITKSVVMAEDGSWIVKQPKTYGSYRNIDYPDFVIEKLKGIEGKIIKATPKQISDRFKRAIIFSHLPHFRFHDLRHYAASIMHAIGVPDQYIMQRGGWSSDNVMKRVYRDAISDETIKQNTKINEHFIKMQHEMQHE